MNELEGLCLKSVCIAKDNTTLIDIDVHIKPGEITSIMGPSGSGKSTLLSFIIGTLAPDFDSRGSIVLDGVDVTNLAAERRRIGILFQDDLLFPHLSVGDNLAFGLSAAVRGPERTARVQDALSEIGLTDFATRDPDTLSGGQKARVALMRMLLSEPKALLLDEPFSRLDTDLRAQIRSLVFEHAKARGLPVLMVTHDDQDANAAGGQVIRL
ncbi:ATP-binding cassette domain-containing protein [Thalassobium sp. R2A62]|uniref:ATP-binding cassette domain-containing protein n=1 Tax=Thalassobium sp. R2A62 TaxID=633131 RepID=UPI0001B1D7A6|nr:ATP-binding cassette domain-containing protein [Thalassobium sp. R2A62]EET49721.1 Fe(3+) ions import ATP-binding protein FbpC [Thalassobium sp. R2A62]